MLWARSRDRRAFFLSLLFGVLIDVDHVLDYWYANGIRFDVRTFMQGQYEKRSKRVFVLLHAFEYIPLLYAFWRAYKNRDLAVAVASAFALHVLADQLLNGVKPWGYFVTYRARHGFKADAIVDWPARGRRRQYRLARKARFEAGRPTIADRVSSLFI